MSLASLPVVVLEFISFLFAISVHEAAHAWVASLRGDETARLLGRVTLNPAKHIDLFGSVVFPLLTLFSSSGLFFGWAKPTPVDVSRLKNRTADDILVSLAGPASNMLLALLSVLVLRVLLITVPGARASIGHLGHPQMGDSLWAPIVNLAWFSLLINVVLAIFNIIPVPPLDGSHVLRHFLPSGLAQIYDGLARNGIAMLVLLIAIVYVGVPDWLFTPVINAFQRLLPVI